MTDGPGDGVNWFQPGSGQQDPPSPPPPYRPPGGPRDQKPWAARHKVLTGFLVFCGLVFVIGIAAAASSSSSSPPTSAAATGVPTVKALVVKPSPTVTKAAPTSQTVTTAPSAQAQATPAPPSTRPPTTAAVRRPAPSTPARTATTTPTPPPTTSTTSPPPTPVSCHPLTKEGNCFEPGGWCPEADHGVSGVAGDGEAIKCENVDGWYWELV